MAKYLLFLLLSIWAIMPLSSYSQEEQKQSIGLVLSGGGADGLAHIGLLKALEENNIQVDYITGASMGALIGSMYSSGYSPKELEAYFTSDEFYNMANGVIEEKYKYYLPESYPDASILTISFSLDSLLKPVLPTNIISPEAIDFSIMEKLAPAAAAAGYNFDSLMIPFRCIASDIYNKKVVVFDSGSLSMAVRASMSYPFFLKPIKVDGKLLLDGGMYNNFPADVMCEEFQPDFIIGSNVASNAPPPSEDDLLSQVRALLVNETNFHIDCINGHIVEPKVNYGTFNFENARAAIDSGYIAALRDMPEIIKKLGDLNCSKIDSSLYKSIDNDSLHPFQKKRDEYRSTLPLLDFEEVEVYGVNNNQRLYSKKTLIKHRRSDSTLSFEQARINYFRMAMNTKVSSIYPNAIYNPKTGKYNFSNIVKTQRDLLLKFGGNFASRPVSHGFVGLQYNRLSKIGIEAEGTAYFGKLYAAGHGRIKVDIPWRIPVFFEAYITAHRWDYFESRYSSLFTDDKPAYVVMNEGILGGRIGTPIGNRGRLIFDGKGYKFEDRYFQNQSFTPSDTSDVSTYDGYSLGLIYEQNNLNDKQYPTRGKMLRVSGRYNNQVESTVPGSTSTDEFMYTVHQEWFQAKVTFENYFRLSGRFSTGLLLEGFYSNQPLFSNYTNTIIRANAFQPTPDSKTLFLESFRANQYGALGLKFIYKFLKNWHFRAEAYVFQPYKAIDKLIITKEASYGDAFDTRHTILDGTVVFNSPIGPFSASVNYYYNNAQVTYEDTPVTFLFNYGFLIFNKKALY